MELLALPLDVLHLVFESLGGAALRSNVGLLCVSSAWYQLAQPVYLSGLDLGSIRLTARALERFPPGRRQLELMRGNTKRLAVRLRGHFWDDVSAASWEGRDGESSEDEQDQDRYSAERNIPTTSFQTREGSIQLDEWRDRINRHVGAFADALPHFGTLEALKFEAFSEVELNEEIGPRWDYLYDQPVARLLSRLPCQGLVSLTLDTCGSALTPRNEDGSPIHICPLIQRCLRSVRNVRLRMRSMCPRVLLAERQVAETQHDVSWNPAPRIDAETDLDVEPLKEFRVESLVIKLNMPMFPDAWRGTMLHLTQPCPGMESQRSAAHLYKDIAKAVRKIRRQLLKIKLMRISYVSARPGSVDLLAVDCLTDDILYDRTDNYYYEEDIPPLWWETSPHLHVVGTFDYNS